MPDVSPGIELPYRITSVFVKRFHSDYPLSFPHIPLRRAFRVRFVIYTSARKEVQESGWTPYAGQTPETASPFPRNQWVSGSSVFYDAAGNQTGIATGGGTTTRPSCASSFQPGGLTSGCPGP